MSRRAAVAITVTGLALVLLLGFRTPDDAILATGGADPAAAGAATTAAPSATTGSSATPTPEPTRVATGAYEDGTVAGSTVDTRFGPVQVEVTISDGRIADVTTLQLPWGDRRSVEISEQAAAILREEALTAQSAEVDHVSGATYTSAAYVRSLQSALDQAQA
jgi:uncharacterized protein with FMN-binding domain